MTHREADTLAYRFLIETADRSYGAVDFGLLGQEFDSSVRLLLSHKPGTAVSGSACSLYRSIRPYRA